jgi:predicted extracellular nuclease
MRFIFFTFFLVTTISTSFAQIKKIAFYNVENLFDTIKSPNDSEFTPDGKYKWNSERYFSKLSKLNQVIDSLGDVLLLGICEVENKQVVRDLINQNQSLKSSHGFIHEESLDHRGIDVALIYDSLLLKKNNSGIIRYTLPGKTEPSSRDILWAEFNYKKERFIVMVNHWPSRSGGQEASEPSRIHVAQQAKFFIDSVQQTSKKTKIIFMGDLNDTPSDKAPLFISTELQPQILANSGAFGGTYFYKSEWSILDHIMVSNSFFKKKKIKVLANTGKIHSFPFILETYKGDKQPFRSFVGSKYLGGYSDHLPISIDVQLK